MTVQHPLALLAAVLVAGALVAGYVVAERARVRRLRAAGLEPPARRGRHAAWILLIAGAGLLVVSLARPEASVPVPRAAGTLVIVVDVSASMTATDADPTRLEAAIAAAQELAAAQPDTVDVGVVAFSGGALTAQVPSADHSLAVDALGRLTASGDTSLGEAILGALSTITGQTVAISDDGTVPDLGYWGSATVVVYSDGEDTAQTDPLEAATLAQSAGIHIDTIGVGTTTGTTVEIDGYTVATALDEATLTEIAETTGGTYQALVDAQPGAAAVDLRLTIQDETIELTALFALAALLLLAIGWAVAIARTGRLVP
ncbi:MAG: VWA domain-containing protein [Microbacterium sp.]